MSRGCACDCGDGGSGWCLVALVTFLILGVSATNDRLKKIEESVAPINSTIISAIDSRVESGR